MSSFLISPTVELNVLVQPLDIERQPLLVLAPILVLIELDALLHFLQGFTDTSLFQDCRVKIL